MELTGNRHLAYCTNIHRGETWEETLHALETHTLAVKQRVSTVRSYAIGLRLSHVAAMQLADRATLLEFQRWLDRNDCYVFTINGFPYGNFHGVQVKDRVFVPDWTSTDRLEYTNLLFDILCELKPAHTSGSVSTVPGSFKRFITEEHQVNSMCHNLTACVEYIDRLRRQHDCDLHLGLEPEPLGYVETTEETIRFFERLMTSYSNESLLRECLGVTYDTCHLAVEFEDAASSLARFLDNGVRISKIHLSSALKMSATPEARAKVAAFEDEVYLHQVVVRTGNRDIDRFEDLHLALASGTDFSDEDEWRIHFHVPLHRKPAAPLDSTIDHLLDVLDIVSRDKDLCQHLEMETYTWDVLPLDLQDRSVADQLVAEYEWALDRLAEREIYRV